MGERPARYLDPAAVSAERVTVINAGVYGFISFQGRRHLERFIGYEPDVVLISFGGNEASPNTVEDKAYQPYQPSALFSFFANKSAIVSFIEVQAVKLAAARRKAQADATRVATGSKADAADEPEPVNRVSVADYEHYLETMIDRAQEAGAVPVLLTRPMVYDYHREDAASPMKPYYFATLEVANRRGVGSIDVDMLANHSWAVFDDHAHFNVAGHEHIAEAMATALVQVLHGEPYDLAALRYRSRDGGERLLNFLNKSFSKWRDLDANIAFATRRRMIESITPVYDTSFADSIDGWNVEPRWRKVAQGQHLDEAGGLCFADHLPSFTLTHRALSLPEDAFLMFWVEGESRSDISMRIFWSDDAETSFEKERSAIASYFSEQSALPIRFFHPLPPGTRAVRLAGSFMRREGDLCLRRIYIGAVQAAPVAGSKRRRASEAGADPP